MKKFVKIAAIVVAVVLVIALVAPMVLRGKIAEIVKREANAMLDARLDFEKLDISLLRHFPRASLDLKGLTLVGEEPFAGDTIVAAQRISVVVNVMSLFGDEGFEVTKIILSEPALHAHMLQSLRPILHINYPNSMLSYSKGSRGLFVPSRVIGIFTDTTISLSSRLRQCPDHYTIRAGRNLPDKEFRYLRTVIVTAAVYWGFNSTLLSR